MGKSEKKMDGRHILRFEFEMSLGRIFRIATTPLFYTWNYSSTTHLMYTIYSRATPSTNLWCMAKREARFSNFGEIKGEACGGLTQWRNWMNGIHMYHCHFMTDQFCITCKSLTCELPGNFWYETHLIPKLKCFLSRLSIVFAQSIEAAGVKPIMKM